MFFEISQRVYSSHEIMTFMNICKNPENISSTDIFKTIMHENDSFFFVNDKFGPFKENDLFEDSLDKKKDNN